VKLRELLRTSAIGFVAAVLAICPLLTNGQTANTQFSFGVRSGFQTSLDLGATLQMRRDLGQGRFRLSLNYHFKYVKGESTYTSSGQPTVIVPVEVQYNIFSTLGEILVIKSKKDDHSGLSVGLGPGYAYSIQYGFEYLTGPGIASK
jgi:hypothetical protein